MTVKRSPKQQTKKQTKRTKAESVDVRSRDPIPEQRWGSDGIELPL